MSNSLESAGGYFDLKFVNTRNNMPLPGSIWVAYPLLEYTDPLRKRRIADRSSGGLSGSVHDRGRHDRHRAVRVLHQGARRRRSGRGAIQGTAGRAGTGQASTHAATRV